MAVVCLALAAGALVGPPAACADDAALAERLASLPFDGSAIENGSQFLDAGLTKIGEQLRSYGVVGSSWSGSGRGGRRRMCWRRPATISPPRRGSISRPSSW
jgi:hypothetical protein